MAFGFAGAGAAAADTLQDMLATKHAQYLQQEQLKLQQAAAQRQMEDLALRRQAEAANQAFRQSQIDRQGRLDQEAQAKAIVELIPRNTPLTEAQVALLQGTAIGAAMRDRQLPSTTMTPMQAGTGADGRPVVSGLQRRSVGGGTVLRETPEDIVARDKAAQRESAIRVAGDPNSTWEQRQASAAALGMESAPLQEDPADRQRDEMARINARGGASAGDVTRLTPQGLDMAAYNYARTGQMPPLGMGDRNTRQAIINRAASFTPDDMQRIGSGINIPGNRADFTAGQQTLTQLQRNRAAIGAFEQTAQKNIDVFLEQAGKIVDTGSPLANRPLRAVALGAMGSPEQAAFDAARRVAVNEVARIISNPNLSGQLTDSARHEVESFVPENATLAQAVEVMRVLKRDMGNRIIALDSEIDRQRQGLRGGAPSPSEQPSETPEQRRKRLYDALSGGQ